MSGPDRSIRRRRAVAQLLGDSRATTPVEVVEHLLAVQSQELRSARLAIRARTVGLAVSDIDAALDTGELVVAWLGRGTLHLVRADDHPWLWGLTAPTHVVPNRRRLAQLGITPAVTARAVAEIERSVARDGPQTRDQLAERLDRLGVPARGQAMPHLLMEASIAGSIVRGPMRGRRQAFVHTRDWLGAVPRRLEGSDRTRALAELVRRYLRGHGPAAPADAAAWAGLPQRDIRTGIEAIAGGLVEEGGGMLDLADRRARQERLEPRLLPSFDPYLLGWRTRELVMPPAGAGEVVWGGVIRATAVVDGTVAGTWRSQRRGRTLGVELERWRPLGAREEAALAREAADVARFEGLTPG